ncbi:MAG: GAF domain-containing protein [Desulfobacterium sp.]
MTLEDVNSQISLQPLMAFWENHLVDNCSHMADMYEQVRQKMDQIPDFEANVQDPEFLKEHRHLIIPLMSAVFAPATFKDKIAGAIAPCSFEPFYFSPEFERLFIGEDGFLSGRPGEEHPGFVSQNKRLRVFLLILDRIYDLKITPDMASVRVVPDEHTGLDRYYRVEFDFQFVDVKPLGTPPVLTPAQRDEIRDNMMDVAFLEQYIDPGAFLLSGFTIARASDVTRPAMVSSLESQLIDQGSIFSAQGIQKLQQSLKVLFNKPQLMVGICALHNDRILKIKTDCHETINCLFANSVHLSQEAVQASVWMEAAGQSSVLRVPDLSLRPHPLPMEAKAIAAGVRSMLLSPLVFQGRNIGVLEIFTHGPNELGAVDAQLLQQVTPIFSVAVKRGVDEMNKTVQTLIKEKCTAVHPSVEWRFEQAAINHMERLQRGESSEMEPIVFKDVIPFYGQVDIKNSSLARNRAIELDLTKQLKLALDAMTLGTRHRSWPLLKAYRHGLEIRINTLTSSGIHSGDESAMFAFLTHKVTPVFDELMGLNDEIHRSIQAYRDALDPDTGTVYEQRKAYEKSVSTINDALGHHLELADQKMQSSFPHYFEKHQTDGVDYMMYIGASMMKHEKLASFHVKNMTLWQLQVSWSLVRELEAIKPHLALPLDAGHLILVNHSPLSIRFRFDEKRFDVDGAYDVRQEIIKSRIDKALVKGTGQRLTQPGKIAVVYSNPLEGRQIRQHIEYLVSQKNFHDDLEALELEDLPDVRGLKALRVTVDLDSKDKNNVIPIKESH